MTGSIEPFIKGLYDSAPKCKKCGEPRQYWDDELCIKCRTQEITRKKFGGCVRPLIPKGSVQEDFEQWKLRMKNGRETNERATEGEWGIVVKTYNNVRILVERYPLNHLVREQAIWAIRHPNRKMPKSEWGHRLAPPMFWR